MYISEHITFQISDTNFVVTIVLGDESYSEISETGYQISSEDLENVFMYHKRNLTLDSFKNCRFNDRLVTLGKIVMLGPVRIDRSKRNRRIHLLK